ncbi:spore germination protein [Paenibacillus sp. y28]|uniref:spore germination protein n=1 Tax=Paenibacillus sp. y28 TaxID=3129110 RepID=UPI003016C66F
MSTTDGFHHNHPPDGEMPPDGVLAGQAGQAGEKEKADSATDQTLSPEEKRYKEQQAIPKTLPELKRVLEEQIGLGTSFDIVKHEMVFAGKPSAFVYVNGMVKDDILTDIIMRLSYLADGALRHQPVQTMIEQYIPHIQVSKASSMNDVISRVLVGNAALFVENEDTAITLDVRTYPIRSITEPDTERVVRGAKDGFVETLLTNIMLIRRRLKDPRMKFELVEVGKRSKTNVCIAYVNDIADMDLVESVRDKVKGVTIDGIPLADKQLEEIILGKNWNPYPLVRYSERPDVVAAHMLEGHVVLMVDTSPTAIILPATFFHHCQHAEEYRHTPFIGTYLRWVRYIGIWASLFLLPLWFLMVMNPELKPAGLEFLGPQEEGKLPLLLQFVIVEIGVDMMRMAAVHTPQPIAVAMGLVAAILIGDIAVKTGLFVNEVILYMAVASIGMFATPSYELGLANRIVRLALLVLAAAFKVPGLIIGATLWVIMLALQRSYNSPFLWPFIPFHLKGLISLIIRKPVQWDIERPSITKAYDSTRQPRKSN